MVLFVIVYVCGGDEFYLFVIRAKRNLIHKKKNHLLLQVRDVVRLFDAQGKIYILRPPPLPPSDRKEENGNSQ